MGEEFCKGCRDCANGKNEEEDFSKMANQPITNMNNPFFMNNNKNCISVNDVSNNESFINNDNNHKNESFTTTNNSRLPLGDYEDNKNNKLKSENTYANNINNINNINNENNNNKEMSEKDKERLREIKKDLSIKKIQNAYRNYNEERNNSHQLLCKENSTIPSSEYILDLNKEELDVNLAPEDNCFYLGTKFKNKKDGLGLELFKETNSKYFGIFKNGKRVQAGKFSTNNENKEYFYKGYIKGIYAYGYGLFSDLRNQTSYEGMWNNSMKNGYGIEIYKDNSEYMGTFYNGKKQGIGYYRWLDGSSYEGEWKNNKLEGYGIFKFKDGSIYIGEWVGNRMSGIGQFSYPGIKTYIGWFNRDLRSGFGMVLWHKELKAFVGLWENNKQHGLGKFFANNKIRYGVWKEGTLSEKINNSNDFNDRLMNERVLYTSIFKIDEFDKIKGNINRYTQF